MPAAVAEAPPAAPSAPAQPTNLNNSLSELDSLFPQSEEPSAPEAPEPTPDAPKAPPEPKTPVPKETPKEQPKETPKTPPKETPKPAEEVPVKAKTLREAKEMAEQRERDWKAKYEKLAAEAAKPKEDTEKKTLAERLAEREKRLEALEQELKYSNYERSQEYKDKYETPITHAYASGRSKIASIKIREGRQVDAEGNVVNEGTVRQGTPADFDALMRISDDEQAVNFAEHLFGNKASLALYHRERVQELNSARIQAIEDYRKNGSEREKQTLEQREKQTTEVNGQLENFWKKHQAAPIEKYPQLFKEVDGDEKGNALLQKGFKMASDAFASFGRAADPSLSPEQREKIIETHAALFNWGMAGPRLAHQLQAATKQLKELQAKIAEYEESEPAGGTQRRPTAGIPADDMEGVLSSLEQLATRR